MIEVHAEFPQREVIQANAVVDNEEKTISEVIISAKPEITGVTASVDNETGTPYVDVAETGTGTDFSFDLAFHNLKGDKGEQGEQGEPGQDGQDGTDGTDGQDGFSPSATVEPIQDGAKITITDKDGTTTTNIYNGTDGQDGQDGQAATVTVGTTTTGAAGTNASVVNSGTSSAAVFDFVIPRGDKGDTGNTGATGNGIVNTEYISSSGLVDTYHVNYTNGGHDSFTVTNGRDGTGSITDVQINGTSITSGGVANILTNSAYNASSNKIATMSDVPDLTGYVQKNGGSSTQTISLTSGTGTTALGIKSMASSSYISLSGSSGWLGSFGITSSKRPAFYNGTGYTLAYTSELPTKTSDLTNDSGYITGIGSSDVITALGYTPYNSSNPNGYTSNVGTVTSVNNTLPDANGNVTISVTGGANTDLSNLTATGEAHFQAPLVSGTNIKTINNTSILGSGDISVGSYSAGTGLSLSGTTFNHSNSVTAGTIGTSSATSGSTISVPYATYDAQGHITASGTHTHTVTGFLTGITSTDVTSALGYTPYNSTNPSGYITGSSSYVSSSRFDGEWTFKYKVIHNTTGTVYKSYNLGTTGTGALSYLPNDFSIYKYEVACVLFGNSSNTSYGFIASTATDVTNGIFGRISTNSNSRVSNNAFIVVVTNGLIYVDISGSAFSNSFEAALTGFRRIGKPNG